LILASCLVISAAWRVLYEAQRKGALATTGLYAWVRRPQYVGFTLGMFGFLLQRPGLLTLAVSPVLNVRAISTAGGAGSHSAFRRGLSRHAKTVPGFIPRLGARVTAVQPTDRKRR
jgi:steroid 5-alpha reductase family enzyme